MKFLKDLTGTASVTEGDPLLLEAVLTSHTDNSVRVEWFKDGHQLSAGSRFNTVLDREFIILEILYTFPEDSGSYRCVVHSQNGTIQSNPVAVTVLSDIDEYDTQRSFEAAQHGASETLQNDVPPKEQKADRHHPTSSPQFTLLPPSQIHVHQGEPIRMELRLTPEKDPTMVVEWMKDGATLNTGSRFNIVFDRGVCLLDFAYCIPEDNGQYICVAKNVLGQSSTPPFQLLCDASETIVTTSTLPESTISSLKRLEEFGDELSNFLDVKKAITPPRIVSPLEPPNSEVAEGEQVVFFGKVDPGSGETICITWYKNDQFIEMGSRITGSYELGVATLLIRYAYAEDNGNYSCCVKTEHGEVFTNSVALKCQADATIKNTPLVKGISAIQLLEDSLNRGQETIEDTDECVDPPVIVKMLDELPQLEEGQPVHLNVRVEPIHDNTLFVKWFKNEQQVINGSRFQITFERGVARLDILYTIPNDSGLYWCRAKSKNGQAVSNKVKVECLAGAGIVFESNLEESSEGYKRIQELENEGLGFEGEDFRHREEEETDSPPNFDISPASVVAAEGGPAKFLVRISGHPRPTLQWYLNEEPVSEDSICKVYHDGAINVMEIHRCDLLGESSLRVVAQNPLGSCEANTTLTVVPFEDFRPDLKHITADHSYKRFVALKKVEVTPELSKRMSKSKPTPEIIEQIERKSQLRHLTYKDDEVEQTEQLYEKVANSLKKFDHCKMAQQGVFKSVSKPAPLPLLKMTSTIPSVPDESYYVGQDQSASFCLELET